tara:strand:+ start:129 stop:731 length:603 start_codon:yes stop_codon:yes gene_type:complete
MHIVEPKTQSQQSEILSQYIRDDRLHLAKNKEGSNLKKVLLGLANEFVRFKDNANFIYNEYDPRYTTSLISDWEAQVGIPDDCFTNTGTIEERRSNVMLKLTGINATTSDQFKNIASVLGFNINVKTGVEENTIPVTLPFFLLAESEQPFTIVIEFVGVEEPPTIPKTIPFTIGSSKSELIRCLFEKIKPSHTKILFKYI